MGFELFFVAAENAALLPTAADLADAFAGRVQGYLPPPSSGAIERVLGAAAARRLAERPRFTTLILGEGPDETSLTFEGVRDDEKTLASFTVHRPTEAEWLWDGLHKLLAEFDLFMAYPSYDLQPAVARDGLELPGDLGDLAIVVESGAELRDAIR